MYMGLQSNVKKFSRTLCVWSVCCRWHSKNVLKNLELRLCLSPVRPLMTMSKRIMKMQRNIDYNDS